MPDLCQGLSRQLEPVLKALIFRVTGFSTPICQGTENLENHVT
jgi:hypothetical protein